MMSVFEFRREAKSATAVLTAPDDADAPPEETAPEETAPDETAPPETGESTDPTDVDEPEPIEVDDADEPPSERERPDSAVPWLRRRSTGVALIVVLVAALAISVTGWVRSAGDAADLRHAEDLRSSAVDAASEYAVDLTTYDYRDLEAQQETLAAESTDAFQETFADSMTSLGPIFNRLNASATGEVMGAAVVSADDDGAVVLVFVDQQASSKQSDEPATQASRLRVELVRESDEWLLDKVDLI